MIVILRSKLKSPLGSGQHVCNVETQEQKQVIYLGQYNVNVNENDHDSLHVTYEGTLELKLWTC